MNNHVHLYYCDFIVAWETVASLFTHTMSCICLYLVECKMHYMYMCRTCSDVVASKKMLLVAVPIHCIYMIAFSHASLMHLSGNCNHMYMGVLCCFALFVCLTLLASFFLPSHLSFKNMYILVY